MLGCSSVLILALLSLSFEGYFSLGSRFLRSGKKSLLIVKSGEVHATTLQIYKVLAPFQEL